MKSSEPLPAKAMPAMPSSLLSEETSAPTFLPSAAKVRRKLHRIAEIRRSQNLSLADLARRLGISVAEARTQEQPESELTLSELYRWQEALNVPMIEILVESEDYPDNPIRRRSQLVKVMKTVRTILDRSKEESVTILARTLSEQLIEIMPELVHVTSWPSVGQSREAKDYGQAAYRRFESNVSRAFDHE